MSRKPETGNLKPELERQSLRRTQVSGFKFQVSARSGLTLIEVMLAITILGIGLIAMVAAASRCLSVIGQSKSYETSRNLLNRVELEEPISLKEEIQEESESGTFPHPHSSYRWTRDIEKIGREEDGLYQVRTRVYWSERGNELFDEVLTYLYAPEEKEGGSVVSR